MKTRNITLIIAGLLIIAAGCALRKDERPPAEPTGYVVYFGSPTARIKTKNPDAFKAALNRARWRREIVFEPKRPDISPDNGDGIIGHADLTLPIKQKPGSDGFNVTQRVRFNYGEEQALGELLSNIDQ